jgi:hypothetical protein
MDVYIHSCTWYSGVRVQICNIVIPNVRVRDEDGDVEDEPIGTSAVTRVDDDTPPGVTSDIFVPDHPPGCGNNVFSGAIYAAHAQNAAARKTA